MKIMKTNMLLLDNKLIREDAGNTTTVDAPVPSPVEPKESMKALSFLGMQNLMANPKLAEKVGVMNNKSAEEPKAENYVAPYSSNVAFKQGLKTAAKLAAVTAFVAGAAALQSCDKDVYNFTATNTVTIDLTEISTLINELKEQLAYRDAEQAKRDQQIIQILQNTLTLLTNLNAAVDKQNVSVEELKTMIYGQNEAIIDAIVVLQNITKEEAKAQVDRILTALANGSIDLQTALAQIQALLKVNNELLGEVLATLKDIKTAAEKANEHKDSLLSLANTIIVNQKYSNEQRDAMSAQLDSLIKQNNVQINNDRKIIRAIKNSSADQQATMREVAGDLGVKVDSLISIVSKLNIPVDETTTKADIIALLEQHLAEVQSINAKLGKVDLSDLLKAANEIKDILNNISDQLDKLLAKVDSIYASVKPIVPLLEKYSVKFDEKASKDEEILAAIKKNGERIDTTNITTKEIRDLLKQAKPQVDSLANNTKAALEYLEIIANFQPEIKAAVDSILVEAAKMGKNLTIEEIQNLLESRDPKIKAYIDGLHADNIGKLDEVIGYQKDGNKIATDIYNLLSDKLKNLDKLNPEELKALLQAIYDYLPNLICKCNCQNNVDNNNNVNEGIIDIIH